MNYPIMTLSGQRVQALGDQHFGRKFLEGVPLDRRGDREQMIRDQFMDHMASVDNHVDIHVNMGDVFDRTAVPASVIALVADTYAEAIGRCPKTKFFVIEGNHDKGKDREMVTAFDLLERILAPKGVVFVRNRPTYLPDSKLLFVPWQDEKPTAELVEFINYAEAEVEAAFGHWDVVNPKSDHNMVPRNLNAKLFVTGHDHLRRDEGNIRVVGAMQPLAHGEDWTGEMYLTLTLPELLALEPTSLRNKCIRVVLEQGETMPIDIDCLQLTKYRPKPAGAEEGPEVSMDGFDLDEVWRSTFAEFGVGAQLTATLETKFKER